MKALAVTLLIAAAAISGRAQDTWTLDRCVSYAIDNNISVKRQALQATQGELAITEAKDRFLPQMSGYASQSFNFGRGLTADNTYANRNTSSFSAGAQLSLPIFQGLSAIRRLDYAKADLRALVEQTEAAKDDVELNVIGQYLQALYTAEMVQVARIRLDISRDELARRGVLLDAGKIPELDIYQAQAQVSQDELYLVNCVNDSTMAMLDLRQLLNLPAEADFAIEALPDTLMPLLDPVEVYANALANNHSMKAGRLATEAAEKNVSLAKSGYIPTLSFNAGLGSNYYTVSGMKSEGFGPQMRHNFAKQIGFSLSVPIFDAFSTRNSVRRARIQADNARLQLDDSRQRLYKSIMTAYTQATAAHKKRDAALVAVESAAKAFDAMCIKYDHGKANATEYEKSRSDYTSSLAESVQARYEALLRARILGFYNR